MSKNPVILYSFWRSSCSYRVRIALNLKEISYEIKPINLSYDVIEQFSADYGKVNPINKVPALKIDGHTLVESLAIIHYLDETRTQISLLPSDAYQRAKVREICEMIASGIQPLQNMGLLTHIAKEKEQDWAKQWIVKGFNAIEQLLKQSAGKYCVGNAITMADCCLIPQVYNARKFQVDMELYPIILRIDRELENHPAFSAAHPSRQPDCPPEFLK